MPSDLKRREFGRAVKAEIIRRATVGNALFCEGCGQDLTGKRVEFDHVVAENLVLDKSAKLTAKDGQLLGECCHRGPDGKTAKDTEDAARAKRLELGRAGEGPALKGRPLPPGRPKRRASSPLEKVPLPRRNILTGEVIR